jgi:hypothetical protein
VEGVLGEEEQRFDGRGDRAAFAAVLDGALQGFAAVGEPVEIGDGDAGADDAGGTDLLAEAGDGRVGAGQHGRGEARRVTEGLGQDRQEFRRPRREPVDGILQGRPQVGAPAEEADHEQGVERLDQDLVVRVAGVAQLVDGGGQQPVSGVDVTVAVEQVIGPGDGGRERTAGARVGAARLFQQAGGVAQVAGDDGSQVGGFGQSSAPALS